LRYLSKSWLSPPIRCRRTRRCAAAARRKADGLGRADGCRGADAFRYGGSSREADGSHGCRRFPLRRQRPPSPRCCCADALPDAAVPATPKNLCDAYGRAQGSGPRTCGHGDVEHAGAGTIGTAKQRAPSLDATQTVRALTQLELDDDGASRWFVIQLSLAEDAFDPDTLPNLDIFSVYRLYSVAGIDQGRIMHSLRLGFFSEEISAARSRVT